MMPRPRTSGAPRPGSEGVAAKALPSASIAHANDVSGAPHACGDRRTVAGRAAAALIRPRVAWRRQLRVGAVLADELAAAIGVVLVQEATDRNVDLIRVAEESFAIGGRELERLHIVVKERKRTRSE